MTNAFEKKESDMRIEKFVKGYQELVKKYDVELMGAPQLVPSNERGFNIVGIVVPIDRKMMGVKSPYSGENPSDKPEDILK